MPLTVCIFEDSKFGDFFPLTHMRPVYSLRAGIVPLYDRCRRHFGDAGLIFCCREQLGTYLSLVEKNYPVNIIKKNASDILFLNGRIRDYGDLPRLVSESRISTLYRNNGETVGVLLKDDTIRDMPAISTPVEYQRLLDKEGDNIPDFDTTATMYSYLWEIMSDIDREIRADTEFYHESLPKPENVTIHDGVYWVSPEDIYLGSDVEIMSGAIIDASGGPIHIGSSTKVEAHAAIYGPTFIGPNSVVVEGKITGCSIGHTCRVGGEVEHSVFQSYVNKYHAGFIGHSYVGSWVNFGAMTTNSDLKNNYSNIKVSLNGNQIDTGSNKIGSFIGDHTKFGIGTLLNTGINIGISCNIFGGGLVSDKEIASFQWGGTGNYVVYDFEKAIETARVVTQRRGHTMSDAEEGLLRAVVDSAAHDKGVIKL